MKRDYHDNLTGLFGDPIDQNPTGVMMQAAYQYQDLPYQYITVEVKKENLPKAIEMARLFDMKGFSLTGQHQVDVTSLLDELSPVAKIIGAVNTVRNQDGILIGENTDGHGFVTSLMEVGIMLPGKVVTILGTYGPGRAIAAECAFSGAARIHIIGQSEGKELADLVSSHTKTEAKYIPYQAGVGIPEDTDVVVSCFNPDLYKKDGKPAIDYNSITADMTVCDVTIDPAETDFLLEAAGRGATTVDGFGMLINQATITYALWTEEMAPKQVMVEAVRKTFGIGKRCIVHEDQKDIPEREGTLIKRAIDYDCGDPKRIQHFLKVYEYVKLIGQGENLSEDQQITVNAAAILHDIGIHNAEKKYGSSSGKYQEQEGPAVAEPMLWECGYSADVVDRALFLIAHHHSYQRIDGIDYQILVEADFLVNLYEDGVDQQAAKAAYERIFKTKTGKWLMEEQFLQKYRNPTRLDS